MISRLVTLLVAAALLVFAGFSCNQADASVGGPVAAAGAPAAP